MQMPVDVVAVAVVVRLLINNLLAKNVAQISSGLSLVSCVLRLLSHKTHANEGVEMRIQQDFAVRYGAQLGTLVRSSRVRQSPKCREACCACLKGATTNALEPQMSASEGAAVCIEGSEGSFAGGKSQSQSQWLWLWHLKRAPADWQLIMAQCWDSGWHMFIYLIYLMTHIQSRAEQRWAELSRELSVGEQQQDGHESAHIWVRSSSFGIYIYTYICMYVCVCV